MGLHFKTYLLTKDWIALGLALFLMGLTFAIPRLRQQSKIPETWISSFGGGFAVAYVFLHLLPGFEESNQALGELLVLQYRMTALRDLLVYLVGLAGFLIYFGLQRRAESKNNETLGPSKFDFYLHLGAMMVPNFIITYTMPTRVEVGFAFSILFTAVMGLYFIILDRNLELHYPNYFDHQGRFCLMLALLIGWILATLTEPNNVMLIAMLTSFLGGSVLFNVFRHELPSSGKSSYLGFTIGVVVGSILLMLITVLE